MEKPYTQLSDIEKAAAIIADALQEGLIAHAAAIKDLAESITWLAEAQGEGFEPVDTEDAVVVEPQGAEVDLLGPYQEEEFVT